MKIRNLKLKIQKGVLLKDHTTFRIGGPAKYFIEAETKKEIIEAVKWAKENNLPLFVLGGGSNLLVADKGFNGIVIKIKNEKLKIKNCTVIAEAGVGLGQMVSAVANAGLSGLEWAAGIPGTVGGAVRGNAGAFGGEMKDITRTVTVLEFPISLDASRRIPRRAAFQFSNKFQIKKYKNKECRFSYRESIFKKKKNLIILAAELRLKKGDKKNIKEKIKEYLAYRQQKHPKDPSAGSVFKKVRTKPAAILIHQAGLIGKKIGKASVSQKHSNFIINSGGARAEDVIKLIKLIKKSVKKKFKAILQEEIQFLGF